MASRPSPPAWLWRPFLLACACWAAAALLVLPVEARPGDVALIAPPESAWWSACARTMPTAPLPSDSPWTSPALTQRQTHVRRDDTGRHQDAHAHDLGGTRTQRTADARADPASASSPYALLAVPSRNASWACWFSASYVASNAAACDDVLSRPLVVRPGDVPPLLPPFAPMSFELRAGVNHSCGAWGYLIDALQETGWNSFSATSNPALSDAAQARAAGFLEGALTARQIAEHKVNQFSLEFPTTPGFTGPDPLSDAFMHDANASDT